MIIIHNIRNIRWEIHGDKNQHQHHKVWYNYHYFKEQVGMIQNINQMVGWVSTMDGFHSCD